MEENLICGPKFAIPDEFLSDFSMGGRVPIVFEFRHETSNGSLNWSIEYWDALQPKISELFKNGTPVAYSSDIHLVNVLQAYPLQGKNVIVIGSVHPVYEAIVSRLGGNPSTVEYRKINHNIPGLRTYTVPELRSAAIDFDNALSISSVEHDGLGRYGDPIDPSGDLKAMEHIRRLIKPGGYLFFSVPVGLDAVCWNSHRIYGKARLPLLLKGWEILAASGFSSESLDHGKIGEYSEPVFVLRAIS